MAAEALVDALLGVTAETEAMRRSPGLTVLDTVAEVEEEAEMRLAETALRDSSVFTVSPPIR